MVAYIQQNDWPGAVCGGAVVIDNGGATRQLYNFSYVLKRSYVIAIMKTILQH